MSSEVLSSVPLFANLSAEELEKLTKLVEVKGALKGQVLFKEGDPPDAFYVVSRGKVKIAIPEMGKRKGFTVSLAEGQFFGEMGVIEGSPRCATATVSDDAILLAVTKKAFDQMMATNPEISEKVMREVATRKKQLAEKTEAKKPKKKCKVILVYSPCGGAGATFVACNVAQKISHYTNKRVGFLDGDLQLGLAHVYFNHAKKGELARIIEGNGGNVDSLSITSASVEVGKGIDLLPAPGDIEASELFTPDILRRVVEELAYTHEYVVIDAPKDLNERTMTFFELADQILLVLEPNLASVYRIGQVFSLLKKMEFEEAKIVLVVNKLEKGSFSVEDIEKHSRRRISGAIPYDRAGALKSLNAGKLVVTHAPESECGVELSNVARTLVAAEALVQESVPPKKGGGFANLWGLLG